MPELRELLASEGFEVVSQEDRDGGPVRETGSFSMITVATKG